MSRILAIDPGPERSAALWYDTAKEKPLGKYEIFRNEHLRIVIAAQRDSLEDGCQDMMAIEMIACYGMSVGKEVFQTCLWIGRFIEAFVGNNTSVRAGDFRNCVIREHRYGLVYRKDVKMHLCHSMRATDANIRAALLDRFGPGKEKAVGTKRSPGPLYGIKKDLWSALAIAVTCADTGACDLPQSPDGEVIEVTEAQARELLGKDKEKSDAKRPLASQKKKQHPC